MSVTEGEHPPGGDSDIRCRLGACPVGLARSLVKVQSSRFCAGGRGAMVPWLAVASREDLRVLRRCGSVSQPRSRSSPGGGMPCSIVACRQGCTSVEGRAVPGAVQYGLAWPVHADDDRSWSWPAGPERRKPAREEARGARWHVPHTTARREGPLCGTSRANHPPYRGPVASADSGSSPPAGAYQNNTGGETFEPDGSAAATATASIMDRKPGALIA